MFSFSVLSMLATVPIILTHIYFKDFREKNYFKAVFYLGVSDFLTSLGSSVGQPVGRTPTCWFQGIVTNIYTLSGILWSVIISHMMYEIVVNERSPSIRLLHHLSAWGIPIVATFLPLINMTYSSQDDEIPSWCWVAATDSTPAWMVNFWYWFSFYFIIFGSILCMLVFLGLSLYHLRKRDANNTTRRIHKTISVLFMYPIIASISWVFAMLYDFDIITTPAMQKAGVFSATCFSPTGSLDCFLVHCNIPLMTSSLIARFCPPTLLSRNRGRCSLCPRLAEWHQFPPFKQAHAYAVVHAAADRPPAPSDIQRSSGAREVRTRKFCHCCDTWGW